MPLTRLAGWALMAAFALVVAIAMAKVGSCDYDCGDRGGRGAFLGVLAATPLAVIGATLAANGRTHRLAGLLRQLAAAGGVLLGILAMGLLLHAADRLAAGITGTDLNGPMNDLDQARGNARTEGVVSALAGLVVATLAAGGLLPHLSAGDSAVAQRWTRRVLVLLMVLCAAITLLGLATAINAPLMLPFALVGATGAGAAAYLLVRESVRDTN